MCIASIWSIPTASASRRSTGPRRASGTPSRPIAGPGWCCWPTPSSAWPAAPSPTCTCLGSDLSAPSAGRSPRLVFARGFRSSWSCWARPRTRQNPVAARPAAPRERGRDRHRAIRPSRKSPDFRTDPRPAQNTPIRPRSVGCPWVKSQAKGVKNKAAAEKFVDFFLGPEVQVAYARGLYYAPVNQTVQLPPDVAAKVHPTPDEQRNLQTIPWDKLSARESELSDRWNREIAGR